MMTIIGLTTRGRAVSLQLAAGRRYPEGGL